MENRHGLLVDFQVTQATGTAEINFVPVLLDEARERLVLERSVATRATTPASASLRCVSKVTPHVAQNTTGRRSAIDGRTTSWPG